MGAGRFSQRTYSLGESNFPCDKALAEADSTEDEELIRKLTLSREPKPPAFLGS
jgi:hypothetical protein